MDYRWQPLLGIFEETDEAIWFRGNEIKAPDGPLYPSIGNLITDHRFSGGTISAEIEFTDLDPSARCACELILYRNPAHEFLVTAGLGGEGLMFAIRHCDSKGWHIDNATGDRRNLKPNKSYHVAVTLKGSAVVLTVDGVHAVAADLPFPLGQSQVGVWCGGFKDIAIRAFDVKPVKGRVFVVMQFGAPYDELFSEVITPVCERFDLDAVRADEVYGPGLIVADIAREILESKLVIAEVTLPNPNVYYEVGYAHAVNKPTIPVAEEGTKLPFDVAPLRTIFYKNSIGGKRFFEEELTKNVRAILRDWYGT